MPSGLTGTEFLDKSNARSNAQSGTGTLYIADAGSNKVMMQVASASGATAEELVLNPYGCNVGIGTSSPSQQLHLSGSTPIIRLTDTDTSAYGEISSSSSDGNLMFFADQGNTQANTTMRFYVDASEAYAHLSSG